MALQTSIAQYFNSRKRQAVDDVKKVGRESKVLILDKYNSDVSSSQSVVGPSSPAPSAGRPKTIIYPPSENSPRLKPVKKSTASGPKQPRKTPKPASAAKPSGKRGNDRQTDIRRSLLPSFLTDDKSCPEKKEDSIGNKPEAVNVPFTIKGLLSPKKKAHTAVESHPSLRIESEGINKEEALEKDSEANDSGTTDEVHKNILGLNEKEIPLVEVEIVESGDPSSTVVPEEGLPRPKDGDILEQPAVKNVLEKNLKAADRGVSEKKSATKDLRIKDIRAKLLKSSRLEEIKSRLKNLSEKHDVLLSKPSIPPKSPSFKKFSSIEVDVPSSPSKTPMKEVRTTGSPSLLRRAVTFKSPVKSANLPYTSPRKLFEEKPSSPSKSPAYQRYQALVESGKPALVLPYKYRSLAETFRSVDTIVSLMYNRKETIVMSKLRHSVQELSKRNLTEKHLAQILTVYPKAFKLAYEKVRTFGAGSTNEKYELTLTPLFDDIIAKDQGKQKCSEGIFNPTMLLERRRLFFNSLLDIAKGHHDVFLKSLDPPLDIPKEKLTRWHPDFDPESCPNVEEAFLPLPPNSEKSSSARDVLNRARDLFGANPRVERALLRVSQIQGTPSSEPLGSGQSSPIPALSSALRGIPKSLLEKVRARQAAKAMELLTQPPEELKAKAELKRLPEMARIVRNVFVGEKKNVLEMGFVLDKLKSSYRESLTVDDFDHHLNLLVEKLPGWLQLIDIDYRRYIKIDKAKDMGKILSSLEGLIAETS